MFFINNESLQKEYNKDNYLEVETSFSQTKQNITAIYFSSNDIYYPNTAETFEKTIVIGNRYEWLNNKIQKANKHIYVRDLYKSWYITGINSKVNSLEKLICFLKGKTQNDKIITIGSSAGGYAAIVCGIELNAEYILSFSGQFSIWENSADIYQDDYPYLFKYKSYPSLNYYYDLSSLIKQSNVPIFYFVSSQSACDQEHISIASTLKTVHQFQINSKNHGIPFPLIALEAVINMSLGELFELSQKVSQKSVSGLFFAYKVLGIKGLFINSTKMLLKKIKRKIKKRN